MILSGQSRAARSLLGWTQDDLAVRSGVSLASVKRAEAGSTTIAIIENAISDSFKSAGVVFLERGSMHDGREVAAGVILLRTPAAV